MKRKILTLIIAALTVLCLAACGSQQPDSKSEQPEVLSEIAGDYYIDLSELGMKLTIYLRINNDSSFIFSNTTAFEVNKSSGTIEKTDDGYLMVYTSVNAEDKSVSDGITSRFRLLEDKSLDFTVCERIYYGTATATTTSADNPSAKLIAKAVTADYVAPSNESDFQPGIYTAEYILADKKYICNVHFFEDDSYIIILTDNTSDDPYFYSETGRYGVSTTQLALTPNGGNRISCDVISSGELSVSIPVPDKTDERKVIKLELSNEMPKEIMTFKGNGTVTGSKEVFEAALKIYSDGSFESICGGFAENGIIALDTSCGSFKLYPDNPTNNTQGINQVSTVPSGKLKLNENGKIILEDFRIRRSESLNRDKCTFTQEES